MDPQCRDPEDTDNVLHDQQQGIQHLVHSEHFHTRLEK